MDIPKEDTDRDVNTNSRRVRSLAIVLQDVDVVLADCELDDDQKADLGSILQSCRNVLGDLESLVQKYADLESSSRGIKHGVKRAWKRFEWDPDELRELRSRIASNIAAFNNFLIRQSR